MIAPRHWASTWPIKIAIRAIITINTIILINTTITINIIIITIIAIIMNATGEDLFKPSSSKKQYFSFGFAKGIKPRPSILCVTHQMSRKKENYSVV